MSKPCAFCISYCSVAVIASTTNAVSESESLFGLMVSEGCILWCTGMAENSRHVGRNRELREHTSSHRQKGRAIKPEVG